MHIEDYNISKRAKNICKHNNIMNLSDLIEYYNNYNSFLSLRSCGPITNNELVELVSNDTREMIKLPDYLIEAEEDGVSFSEIVEQIPKAVYDHLKIFVSVYSHFLSLKCKRVLNILSDEIDIYSVMLLEEELARISKLKNIGDGTLSELIRFLKSCIYFINIKLDLNSNISSKYIQAIKILSILFHLPENALEEYSIKSFINNEFEIFRFLDMILQDGIIIPIVNYKALLVYSDVFIDMKYSMEMAKQELSLTRERIRQIKINSNKILKIKLQGLKLVSDILLPLISPNSIASGNYYFVDNKMIIDINSVQQSSFSKKFVYEVLQNICYARYDSFEYNSDDNDYLFVRRELIEIFDVGTFIEELINYKNQEIKFDYRMPFAEFFQKYYKGKDLLLLKETKELCYDIVDVLNLSIDLDNNIIFEANTNPLIYEKIYKILDKHDEPMQLEQLHRLLKKQYNYSKSHKALRGSIISRPDVFISFGRTSTYGLRKWEKSKPDIRGGTIKDIVEEYLKKFDQPKNIREIEEYVNLYRNTNYANILTNLKIGADNRFYIYPAGYVGLNYHTYNPLDFEYTTLPVNIFFLLKNILLQFKAMEQEDLYHILDNKYHIDKILFHYYINDKIKEGRLIRTGTQISLTKK